MLMLPSNLLHVTRKRSAGVMWQACTPESLARLSGSHSRLRAWPSSRYGVSLKEFSLRPLLVKCVTKVRTGKESNVRAVIAWKKFNGYTRAVSVLGPSLRRVSVSSVKPLRIEQETRSEETFTNAI
eukprot:3674495-Pleurochrysis_carterae.AAC.4